MFHENGYDLEDNMYNLSLCCILKILCVAFSIYEEGVILLVSHILNLLRL